MPHPRSPAHFKNPSPQGHPSMKATIIALPKTGVSVVPHKGLMVSKQTVIKFAGLLMQQKIAVIRTDLSFFLKITGRNKT